MSKYDYSGDKTKNYFTAYLQKCIKWKRWSYLNKKERIQNMEKPLEDMQIVHDMMMEEMVEIRHKEEMLLRERNGDYPSWNELSDQRLISSLRLLREDERKFIYQHVFEEWTFEEISLINEISIQKVKGIYYYAIRKIRKRMGGR